MKNLFLAALAAALMAFGGTAYAATTSSGNFNVNMTLTPICVVSQAPGALSMTYVPFGGAQTASTTVKFACSYGLAPSQIALTTTGNGTLNNASTTAPSASGVLNGVAYTLTTTGFSTTPTTAGTAATATAAATANEWAIGLTADAVGNQAGEGTTSTSSTASHVYTLVITY